MNQIGYPIRLYCDASVDRSGECRIGYYAEIGGLRVLESAEVVPVPSARHGLTYLLEIYSISKGLQAAYGLLSRRPNVQSIVAYSDCQSVVNVLNNKGKATRAEELYRLTLALISEIRSRVPVEIVWIPRWDRRQVQADSIAARAGARAGTEPLRASVAEITGRQTRRM